MNRSLPSILRFRLAQGMLFVLGLGFLFNLTGCGQQAGTAAILQEAKGVVQVRASSQAEFTPGKDGDSLLIGGAVKTAENATARLRFADAGEVLVKPESFFEIGSGQPLGKQSGGSAVYRVNKQKDDLKIETPQGVTAVLGTVFLLKIDPNGTIVVVEEGQVSFTNLDGQTALVNPGEQLTAAAKGPLPAPVKIDPITRDQMFGNDQKGPGVNQR
jgi:hypothetical protein